MTKLGLISDKKIFDLKGIGSAVDFFKALSLVWAYQTMIYYAERGLNSHPEVQRAPELRDLLLDHLVKNYVKHIRPEVNQIFNGAIVGTTSTLRGWQEAGYFMKRTRRNYPQRLRKWRALYDNTDYIVKRKKAKVTVDESGNTKSEQYANLGRVRDKDGNIVTYEIVIQRRNSQYGPTKVLVPFWLVLNYGSNGYRGLGVGYPSVPGIFFVENAEKRIPEYQARALRLYEAFAFEVLTKEKQGSSTQDAFNWTKRRGTTFRYNYFDHLAAALEVAEVF
jgi:hypothetical protein